MLFTTAPFAFLYLPIVAIVFFALGRAPRAAAAWLGLASLFFYCVFHAIPDTRFT